MNVVINGADTDMRSGSTVHDALARLGLAEATNGVAVARNGEVILRSRWNDVELDPGDRLEVLHAVQGG